MTSSLRYQFLGASLSTFGMTYMRSPAIDVNTTRGPFSMFGLCASSQLAYSVKMTLASNCQPASKYIQKIPKEHINKLSKPSESCPAFNKLHSATLSLLPGPLDAQAELQYAFQGRFLQTCEGCCSCWMSSPVK